MRLIPDIYISIFNSCAGRTHRYQSDTGRAEEKEKEAVLGESDSMWVELRHLFIAEVYTTLAARFNEFHNKNKAAKQLSGGAWLFVLLE